MNSPASRHDIDRAADRCDRVTSHALRRPVLGVTALVFVFLSAGCASARNPATEIPTSSASAPSTSPRPRSELPPRTVVLPLDGVEPCALVAGTGAGQLGVGPGSPHGATSTGDAAQCQWSTLAARPHDNWMARVLLHTGANTVFVNRSDTPLTQVDGVTAVQVSPQSNPTRECVLYLDVAPQQSLLVEYSNDSPAGPGTTHTGACQHAQNAATGMVQRLRTLVQQPR